MANNPVARRTIKVKGAKRLAKVEARSASNSHRLDALEGKRQTTEEGGN